MILFLIEKIKTIFTSRLFWVTMIFAVLTFVLLQRMFELQIVQGDTNAVEESYYRVVERYIPSTRGLIYDVNGELLAYNELSYSVMLEDSALSNSSAEKNKSILKMINILKEHGYEIELDFAIELDENGELIFNVSGTSEQRFKKNAYGLRSVNDLSEEQKEATAEEVFNFLRYGDKSTGMFQVSKEYSLEEQYDMIKKSQIHLTDTDMMSETVFHAFTAPVVICCDFNDFSTQNILSSAFNHTTGDENMSLFDEIIFIADYVEENRKHPNCIKVRDDLYRSFELSRNKEECVSHLHNATVQALDFTISHLLKNGNIINLRTVKTRNAFLGRLPMLINDLQKGI